MRQSKGRSLLILAILFCSGCTWLTQRMAVTQCTFEWLSVSHQKSSLTHTRFKIDLKAGNPNNTDATLDRIVYTFYADDLKLVEGSTPNTVHIPAGESVVLPIELKVSHLSAVEAIARVYEGRVSRYRLTARVYMRTPWGEMSHDIELWNQGS